MRDDNWHVPLDREEGERILEWDDAAGCPRPADLERDIKASWVRMFELDDLYRSDLWKPAEVHANFEELRLDDVVEAKVRLW